jgi:hypothetical protein
MRCLLLLPVATTAAAAAVARGVEPRFLGAALFAAAAAFTADTALPDLPLLVLFLLDEALLLLVALTDLPVEAPPFLFVTVAQERASALATAATAADAPGEGGGDAPTVLLGESAFSGAVYMNSLNSSATAGGAAATAAAAAAAVLQGTVAAPASCSLLLLLLST